MKKFWTIMAIAALIPNTATPEEIVRILTPPEHASVSSGSVQLIGESSAPKVSVYLNNVFLGTTKTQDSFFHKIVDIGYGVNQIVVSADLNTSSGVVSARDTVEALYMPKRNPKFEKFYPEYIFHGSSKEGVCAQCHDRALDADTLLPASSAHGEESQTDQVGCFSCHIGLRDKFHRHIDTGENACVICHARGEGLKRAHSAKDNLCFTCHPERKGMFSQEYVHGPVAGGSCICHDPHGSEYEKNLVSPVRILCVSCHTEMDYVAEKKVVHHPFEEGDCVACHDPHATNNRWVLVKNSQEVCMSCHKPEKMKREHAHPYNVRPQHLLETPLKLTASGQLECISCHSPHATSTDHLLRTESEFTCLGCHEGKM